MGLMSLAEIKKASWEKKHNDMPGKSVMLQIEGVADDLEDVEMYHSPGVLAIPAHGGNVILVDAKRGRVAVAHHDYRVDITVEEGETAVYSTDSNGTVKAKTVYKKDGAIKTENDNGSQELASDGKTIVKTQAGSLASILCDLIDYTSGMKTMGPPPQHVVSPDDIAKFTALKTKLQQVLKD